MKLNLQNEEQHMIADLLWSADSGQEVDAIIRKYGHEAEVVYQLMVAEYLDQVEDTDLAEEALSSIGL